MTSSNFSFALALWNGRDPIPKERLFGLTNREAITASGYSVSGPVSSIRTAFSPVNDRLRHESNPPLFCDIKVRKGTCR
jgi:hypothetical protein